jgi:feruloyl esterase
MKFLLAGAVVALFRLAHAAPSPNSFLQSRQQNFTAPKNCNPEFFNSVIANKNLGGRLDPSKLPYTPDTEPYPEDQRVLYYANHETGLNINDICGVRVLVTDDNAFELYLPDPSKWNRRFLTVGNGGFSGGTIRQDMFSRAVHSWATMSTNTGHDDASASLQWGHNQPERQIDWAWRAMAQSVPYAKELVKAYYEGIPSAGSYYSGCSTGGRQGIRQVEVDPNSFDAMLIGAPAWNVRSAMPVLSRINWLAEKSGLAGVDTINVNPPLRIAGVVFNQCNGIDGSVWDGVVRDYAGCLNRFRGSESNETLWQGSDTTVAQRAAFLSMVEEFFKVPPQNESYAGDGFDINSSYDMFWSTALLLDPSDNNFSRQFAKYFLNTFFPQTEPVVWDSDEHGFQLVKDSLEWDNKVRANANPEWLDTTRHAYKGQTILYTGTADGWVSANGTRRAFEMAGGTKNNNLAYFEIPGMSHCMDLGTASVQPPWYIGGVGLHGKNPKVTFIANSTGLVNSKHDALLALVEWHEGGSRPETITSTYFTEYGTSRGKVVVGKKRPVCRWPKKQVFNGLDNPTDANDETKWSCA